MWTGKDMGTYKGKKFRQTIEPHASALFKVTPVE